ncbi:hypothetical protein Tco_0995039, partial [Tanacetum coccineum]
MRIFFNSSSDRLAATAWDVLASLDERIRTSALSCSFTDFSILGKILLNSCFYSFIHLVGKVLINNARIEETASANRFVCLNSKKSSSKAFTLSSNLNKEPKALLAGKVLSFFVLLLGFDLLAAEAPFTPIEGIPGTSLQMSQPGNDEFSQHLSDDEASNHEDASDTGAAPKQQQQVIPQTTAISNIKLLILKMEEYDIWAMEMEHYLEYINNEVWKVILNGNSKKRISTGKDGVIRIL